MVNVWESISPQTKHAIQNLAFDRSLGPPATIDYGVDSPQHYRALKEATSYYPEIGETEEEVAAKLKERWAEFQKVRGKGKEITAFVEKYAPRFKGVIFRTNYDEMRESEFHEILEKACPCNR